MFVLAQVGVDHGYITVDHGKIKEDVEKQLDISQLQGSYVAYQHLNNISYMMSITFIHFHLVFFLFFSQMPKPIKKILMLYKR